MVTMNDVSRHAGVSVATVSNVITGKKPVSEKMRKRVMDSIEALDYQVNLVARGLKTQRTFSIGLILPDITKLFFQKVISGILDAATQNDYRLNIVSSGYDFETERMLFNTLKSSRVDGVILDSCVSEADTARWLREISPETENSFPVVVLENTFNTNRISSVTVDNASASARITQHLIDIGRRKILYVVGPLYIEHEHARISGYRSCLQKNGIEVDPRLEKKSTYMSESGYNAVIEALREGVEFDAIQASNDQAAIGAMKALREYNLRIPEDIAVAGFDNLFPSTLISPALTTIDVPNYEMGVCAVNELMRRINDPIAPPCQQKLETQMIVRASTSPRTQTNWDLEGW